jgi:nucleotide-binding universal stress UspA family protein
MKVLWGFEPKSQSKTATRGMHRLLRQLAGKESNISVGYVVTENELYLHTAYDIPFSERFSAYPKKLILGELRAAAVKVPKENVKVAHYPSLSNTKAADKFLKMGKQQGAELVALFTKGKRGIERLMMGSFAETTTHRSGVDVLLMGPKGKVSKRIKKVVYAADFSPDSKKGVRRMLKFCRKIGAQLYVFHSPRTIYKWAIDEKDPAVLAYRRQVDNMAKEISDLARLEKVDCEVIIQTDFRSPSELAIDLAKELKADLLAVSAKTGPIAAFMGGSVTRQLVRNSSYPVLVLK